MITVWLWPLNLTHHLKTFSFRLFIGHVNCSLLYWSRPYKVPKMSSQKLFTKSLAIGQLFVNSFQTIFFQTISNPCQGLIEAWWVKKYKLLDKWTFLRDKVGLYKASLSLVSILNIPPPLPNKRYKAKFFLSRLIKWGKLNFHRGQEVISFKKTWGGNSNLET